MPQPFTADDERHMRRALALAERGRGRVEPNPVVGCVLVRRGQIVGEGYHRNYGGPHAEVWALRRAGAEARGATAYVTLEPCCHYGQTPPCTEALIAAGVVRVVAAMRDLSPPVCGQGVARLKAAGIEVSAGLLETESMRMNAAYLKRKFTGRPWVILKWAQSLDGKIATRTGDSKWISGEASRAWVHRLRGRVDAIVVGVGTAIADDPLLTCRHGRPRRIATRVVLDAGLRLPVAAQLVRTARQTPTLVVTDRRLVDSQRARRLVRAGVQVMGVERCGLAGSGGRPGRARPRGLKPEALRRGYSTQSGLDLKAMLDELGRRGMTNVMVEGGGRTLGAFHDAGLADEALVFVSPRLIGGRDAVSALAGDGPASMSELRQPAWVERRRVGDDTLYCLVFTDPAQFSVVDSQSSASMAGSTSRKPRRR